MKKLYTLCLTISIFISTLHAQVLPPWPPIGETTYDLQTNASSCNRICYSNGQVVATWNHSNALTSTFPDRGVGYNYFNGANWNPAPISAIDSCVWPSIDIGANIEYIIGHNRPPATGDLTLLKRSPVGSGVWQKSTLPPDPNGHLTLWPRMSVGGPNDSTIHVIALTRPTGNGGFLNNGIDGCLTYSRSQDGGVTWDLIHTLLPGIDSTNYVLMSPETYAIDVSGSTVAIVQGSLFNDWVLWKSIDNGTTWSRQVIKSFPIPAFNPQFWITDVDGDGVADTVETIDGSNAVLIDNSGMVHCWSGRMLMIHNSPGPIVGYFPLTDGLFYWSESFNTDPPVIIAAMEDLDANGLGIPSLATAGGYECSLTSMPSAGTDGSMGIFLVYSSVIENTDDGSGRNFRNVYAMHSDNNGINWSTPFRIEQNDFDEQVYPSVPREVDSLLRLMYQVDGMGGISFYGGTIHNNSIVYYSEDTIQLFNPINPVPVNHRWISGRVFGDTNQNQIFDGSDFPISNHTITLGPANDITTTNIAGNYLFQVVNGSYSVNYNVPANWVLTTGTPSYTVNVGANITNLNFGLFPVIVATDATMDMTPSSPRCNAFMNFYLNVTNTGSTYIQGHIKFIQDPQMTMISSSPVYSTNVADTFYWNMGSFSPFETKSIILEMGTAGLMAGTNISNCTSFSIDPSFAVSQDTCINQTIICAFDPNDKSAFPEGVGSQHYTLISDSLLYTIRFQNTGTDTAFTVRIRDTLDAALDVSTFEIVSSSHPMTYTMKPDRSVFFEFENILLPDSNVNEPGSNGYLKYRIHPVNGIPEGTVIENTAYIYFDYNPPIQTNTAMNTMVSTIGIVEVENYLFNVYPNPTNGNTYMTFENPENEKFVLELTDITGKQIIVNQKFSESPCIIQTDELDAGMYFMKILSNKKIISAGKIIKVGR